MFPFEVGIEEEGLGGHFVKGGGGLEDCVAEGLEEGFVQVVEHWILDINMVDLVFLPCLAFGQ